MSSATLMLNVDEDWEDDGDADELPATQIEFNSFVDPASLSIIASVDDETYSAICISLEGTDLLNLYTQLKELFDEPETIKKETTETQA